MHNYISDIFHLKSNTQVQDIWQCISECFMGTEYSGYFADVPMQKLYVNDTKQNFILEWNCPNDRQAWFEFKYVGSYKSQNVSIRIVFDNKIAVEQNVQSHYLVFEEKNNGDGEIVFYQQFLVRIRKLASDKHYNTQIINDTDGILFHLLLMGEQGIAVTKKIADGIFQHNDEYARFLKQPKYLYLFQKIWNNPENMKVVFYNDESESKLSEHEIKTLKINLWYLNVDFIYCGRIMDQLLSNFTDKIGRLEKIIPSDRQGRQYLNTAKQRKFQSMRSIIQDKAKIRIFSAKGKLIKEYDSLDDFQNDLLNHFDFSLSDFEAKIKSEFSDYYDNQSKNESEINQRVELRLKEIGVESLAERCRQLEDDNNNKDKKIRDLENKIASLEAKSLSSESEDHKKSSADENMKDDKFDEIQSKLDEKETIISNQSDEIYTLNHRIKDLEKKLQKKEKAEYDGSYHLQIPCDVSENYPCEIKDYLYRVLYDVIETDKNNLPNNETGSRKKDILNSLTKSKTFDWEKTETYSKISEIEKIMKGNKRPNIDKLCRVGFVEKERSGDHVKCLFYDIPYPIVFSLSPSDYRNADNMMVNIKQQCFLV